VVSLRRVNFAWARSQTEGTPKSERILAHAKLSRLDEIDSRLGETSSPRRDLAKHQGWASGIFAQERAARLGEIIRVSNCFHMQTTQLMPYSQFITHKCSDSSTTHNSCNS